MKVTTIVFSYDKKNYDAFLYSQQVTPHILGLCKFFIEPLGLTTFGYKRVYDTGEYLFISTNLRWSQYHYQHIHNHGTFFEQAMKAAHINQSHKTLWPPASQDHFLQSLNHFGMWHGINFYKKQANYLELWTFSTSQENGNISSLYLNTLPYFEEFIRHFTLKAREIIDTHDPCRLAKIEFIKEPSSVPLSGASNLSDIISQIKIPKVLVEGSQGIVALTARESDCTKLLSLGKSLKEIAHILGLSPRTVEFHINQVKRKTGCHSKSKLLQLIQSPL